MEIQVDIDELIKLVSTATEAYTTAFLLADNDNRVLKLWHHYSLSDNVMPNSSINFGEGPIGWVAENEKPFTRKFSENDSVNLGIYNRNEDLKLIKSFYAVPVMRDEILEGVLSIDSKKMFVFVPKDQKLLSLFAEQFAALVNNIRIKRFVDTESSDVSFLNNICDKIARTDDIDSILQMTFDSATKLVESESCLLSLRKNEEDNLFQVEMGNIYRNIKRATFSDQDGLAGHVIRTKQAFFHNNRGEYFNVFSSNKIIGRVKSFLGVPMLVKDEAIGIVCFVDSGENAFNHRDLRVISILANTSALAIANLKAQSRADEFSKNVDGLTGLKSFTGFQENLEMAFQEAIQKRRSLSLI
ncbi:GAF domain-containing protein, partial [Candidatus Poribacteria bacterium]|nr:GAF domain-containing protein [Candidatus Poribacteria bacterium]